MPYISTTPARLKNPCAGNQNCTSPFSYKNVLKLTSNGDEFNQLVSQQQISGNLDSPEGGFDAIMQVAVCEVRGSEVEVCLRTTPTLPHTPCVMFRVRSSDSASCLPRNTSAGGT